MEVKAENIISSNISGNSEEATNTSGTLESISCDLDENIKSKESFNPLKIKKEMDKLEDFSPGKQKNKDTDDLKSFESQLQIHEVHIKEELKEECPVNKIEDEEIEIMDVIKEGESKEKKEGNESANIDMPEIETVYVKEERKNEAAVNDKAQKVSVHHCPICGKSFKWANNMRDHMRMHTGKNLLSCQYCDTKFTMPSKLAAHLTIHSGEKPHECDICHRAFSHKHSLKKHLLLHTGERPYLCDICHKTFSRKNNLDRHILTHSGEKRYTCNVCHKTFAYKNNFQRHFLIHTGEKQFECHICHTSFTHKRTLTNHLLIHTGVKPYKCKVCQKCFPRKHNLDRHFKKH